jgi:hypothetical protein
MAGIYSNTPIAMKTIWANEGIQGFYAGNI